MPMWKRLAITIAAMFVASFAIGLMWQGLFNADMPSYLSGVIGGIVALVAWEFLKARR